jgi:hypothetical protein
MVKNIVFRCSDISIDLSYFSNDIEYLCDSRIDNFPIYKTSDNLMFSDYVVDILNTKNKNNLELILRRKKIEKIKKNHKIALPLRYEFLNFWYDNFDDLTIILPMFNSGEGYYMVNEINP